MENKLFRRIIPVGVGVLIMDEEKNVLLGKRIIEDGFGLWSTPGGFLEPNESIFECARRETFEETGLTLDKIEYLGISHIVDKESVYFDIGCISYIKNTEVNSVNIKDYEVHKWVWVPLDDIGRYQLWKPCKALLELYQSGGMVIEDIDNHEK